MTNFKPITINIRWFNRRYAILKKYGMKANYLACPGCKEPFKIGDRGIKISHGSHFYYHLSCAQKAYIDLD